MEILEYEDNDWSIEVISWVGIEEIEKLSIIHVRVEVIVLNNDSDGIDWGMSLVLPSIEYLLRPGKA